jgi:hypothetical protein
MIERVETLDIAVNWDLDVPEACLLMGDDGYVQLAINADPDDQDPRCIVLRWHRRVEVPVTVP